MNSRFSMTRLLIAVPAVAAPYAFLREGGRLGIVAASIIAVSTGALCLLADPREVLRSILSIAFVLVYSVLFLAVYNFFDNLAGGFGVLGTLLTILVFIALLRRLLAILRGRWESEGLEG